MQALESYDWPGNVRELESVLKQALINATGHRDHQGLPAGGSLLSRWTDRLSTRKSPSSNRTCRDPPGEHRPRHDLAAFVEQRIKSASGDLHAETLEMMERYLLTRVLRETGGNQSLAAKILGITRGSLRNKIRSLRLSIDHVVTVSGVGAGSGFGAGSGEA